MTCCYTHRSIPYSALNKETCSCWKEVTQRPMGQSAETLDPSVLHRLSSSKPPLRDQNLCRRGSRKTVRGRGNGWLQGNYFLDIGLMHTWTHRDWAAHTGPTQIEARWGPFAESGCWHRLPHTYIQRHTNTETYQSKLNTKH